MVVRNYTATYHMNIVPEGTLFWVKRTDARISRNDAPIDLLENIFWVVSRSNTPRTEPRVKQFTNLVRSVLQVNTFGVCANVEDVAGKI